MPLSLYRSIFLWLPLACLLHPVSFCLKPRDRRINLILCRTFSTVFPDGTCTRKANEISLYCAVFNCPRTARTTGGSAAQLIGFWLLFPSHLCFILPRGALCTKENLETTNPDSRCLAEVEGQPGLPLPATTLHRHDRASERARGCMSQSQPPTFLPVVQPLTRFFLLCGLFLNRSSCLCAGFLRRKGTVQ